MLRRLKIEVLFVLRLMKKQGLENAKNGIIFHELCIIIDVVLSGISIHDTVE